MLQELTVESRVTALETEVEALKREVLNQRNEEIDWIEQVTGSMEGLPEFDVVLEMGRMIRRRDLDGTTDETNVELYAKFMFLLDTDHFSILQRRSLPEFTALSARMRLHKANEFFVSIVTFHEQVGGWNLYLNQAKNQLSVVRAYQMMEKILTDFAASRVMPFDVTASGQFDLLRARKIRVSTMDLRIAATAMSRKFTLLSRNLVDFRKVPDLQVEDWCT